MRITTKFGENFATFFEGAREGNWANLSWTKVTLEHGGFAVKAGVVQPGKRRCLGCRESVCDGSSELFERRADAHYSRENPGRIDDSHG